MDTNSSSTLTAEQDKDSFLDYSIDWSPFLDDGDSIASSQWVTAPGLTLSSSSFVGDKTIVWAQGGSPNTWYALTNTITTASGRIDSRTIRLFITDDTATASPNDGSELFPNRRNAIDGIRSEYLALAKRHHLVGFEPDDDMLWAQIVSAEAYAKSVIRCPFAPTKMLPFESLPGEVDALEQAGVRYEQEPALDYGPEVWNGESWGLLRLNTRPIISVESIKFNYPAPTQSFFTVPNDWIRLDKKAGIIQLVPASAAFAAPLNAFIMAAMGGGRRIPMMVQVRYTAGLQNIESKWPHLLSAVKRQCVLNLVKIAMTPQSGSISADGLSQSMSFDADKTQESIDAALSAIRQEIKGLTFGVL